VGPPHVHDRAAGISLGFFSAASEAVAIPTGVQIFVLHRHLSAGRVIRSVPMLFAIGALAIFVIGGLTGVMVALAPFDFQAHDTYFIVAHLHYVLIGGMLFPVMAGVYYYYPLPRARQAVATGSAGIAFWLMFVGFNVAFLPMHLTGLLGMPRRVFTYPAELGWDWLNLVSTVGRLRARRGILVFVWDVLRPRGGSRYAPSATPGTPARSSGWRDAGPAVGRALDPADRQPLSAVGPADLLLARRRRGPLLLPDAEEGRARRWSPPSSTPSRSVPARAGTDLPADDRAAVSPAGLHLRDLPLVVGGARRRPLLASVLIWWLWTGTARSRRRREGRRPRPHPAALRLRPVKSVGWWAMFITMTGRRHRLRRPGGFGYFFFWTIHEEPREVESLWTLFTAPVVWALHFLACYVGAAIFCEKPGFLGGNFDTLRIAIGLLTLLSLAMIALAAILAWRQWGFGASDPPHDDPNRRDRLLFQGYATLLLSGLSFIAVIFTALPALFMTECLR
jgi:hypothetical protein